MKTFTAVGVVIAALFSAWGYSWGFEVGGNEYDFVSLLPVPGLAPGSRYSVGVTGTGNGLVFVQGNVEDGRPVLMPGPLVFVPVVADETGNGAVTVWFSGESTFQVGDIKADDGAGRLASLFSGIFAGLGFALAASKGWF